MIEDATATLRSQESLLSSLEKREPCDHLGFFTEETPPKSGGGRLPSDPFVRALELQKRSENLRSQLDGTAAGSSINYAEWLTEWDSYMVMHGSKPLRPHPELKRLVRTGIPHTYRIRVWQRYVRYMMCIQRTLCMI